MKEILKMILDMTIGLFAFVLWMSIALTFTALPFVVAFFIIRYILSL